MRAWSTGACVTLLSCGAAVGPPGDFVAPRIVAVSVGEHDLVSPTAVIRVDFSEAVGLPENPAEVVVVVPHTLGPPCTVDLACPGGTCFAGRCQLPRVDDAWLSDLAHPPLNVARQALTAPLRVELSRDGTTLLVQPTLPLLPQRLHALIIGEGLVDPAGNPLGGPADGPVPLFRVFATGDAADARPVLQLVDPPAGSTDLPVNLQRLVVRFSQAVEPIAEDDLWLAGEDGARVALRPLPDGGPCGAEDDAPCQWLAIDGSLRPVSVWSLQARTTLRDRRGAPLLHERPVELATGRVVDTLPPTLSEVGLVQSDGCVVVRARSNEPADARLSASWSPVVRLSAGILVHELALPWGDAPADARLRLDLRDAAGHAAAPWGRSIAPAPAAPLVISELLADPLGPDPDQEWVELYNRSAGVVELEGWTIEDGSGRDTSVTLPALRLPPQRYALVVGPRFRVGAGADPLPDPAAPLVRLRTALGGRGLANRGDAIRLRSPDGVIASTACGRVGAAAEVPGPGRSAQRRAPFACDIAASWRRSGEDGPTPGR